MSMATIKLEGATKEQLSFYEEFCNKGKKLCKAWIAGNHLLISYLTKSGFVVLCEIDPQGKWVRSDYYLSYDIDMEEPVYHSWVAQKVNTDYGKE